MNGVLIERQRRLDTRFDFSGQLFFQASAPADQHHLLNEGISRGERSSAQIKNASRGGCCFTVNQPLEKFQIIKIDFPLPQASLSIPTLAEVRWVRIEPELEEYQYNKVGVRYLL